jgi:hypothetical protein
MKRKKVVLKTDPLKYPKYLLPPFLQGVISLADYRKWLEREGRQLNQGDIKLNRPYAKENSISAYKQKIHLAVLNGGEFDPYTGEKLRWDLITHKNAPASDGYINDYLNEFSLRPAVDHSNPKEFEFEICSWISNESKSSMVPDEFVDFCRRVVRFRGA